MNMFRYVVCFEQQLIGLQELYNAQQLLTSELSNKLEKTQVSIVFC